MIVSVSHHKGRALHFDFNGPLNRISGCCFFSPHHFL